MDKSVYVVNETAVIKVNRTQNVNITCIVANRTDSVRADNFTIQNDGNLGMAEYSYHQALGAGDYALTLTQGSESVEINFEVASEILKPFARLMGSTTPVFVNTSTNINTADGGIGGNFSELLQLNKSAMLHYGYAENLTGNKTYHFVVLDTRVAGVYDTVYVDDDKKFQLYNDTEDNSTQPFLEVNRRPGEMLNINSTDRFIVANIESTTGRMVFLVRPLSSSSFSSSDTLYMIVFVMNGSGNIQKDKMVNVSIHDESKAAVYSNLVTIGSEGYVNLSVNLSGYAPGKYAILANQTPVDFFKVETFRLNGKITDLSGNPASSFAPGSVAKVWVVARNVNGNLISLDSNPSGTITLPSGSTSSLSFSPETNATGVYTAESPALTQTGEYKVVISGVYGSNTERFDMGFRVQSIEMTMMTLNPKYIDEGPGQGATIAAFAPNSNITAAIFMINATKGSGLMTGGPPCGFDGESCVRVSCDSSQFGVTVRDEFGNRYKLSSQNFSAMTIGQAVALMSMEEGPQEPGMNDQCMVFIWGQNNTWLNKTGNYKLEVKFSNSSVGNFENGQTFSVQKLLATGSTVDFKGDSFSFLAPNSTVRVKLEIRDMATDEILSAGSILNAKFTSMWKEWPERKNAFTEITNFSKALLNESIQNVTIVFNSPPEEGFYSAEFRFQANLSGEVVDGTGTIYFELKKYMIWAQLSSMSQGNWYVKAGQNITLTVNMMDIDMGSQYGSESLEKSCTGCAGLIANVSALRNEQFFKEMVEGVDYTVTTGVVINSTSGATIVINPIGSHLTPGWYGIDVVLQRPGSSEAYYGWGGFEVRNFWVEIFEVNYNETSGNYTRASQGGMSQGGTTVAKGGSALFGVAAYEPPTPMTPPSPVLINGVTVEGLQDNSVWPPLTVSQSDFGTSTSAGILLECYGEQCESVHIFVVNFSAYENIKESDYLMNVRVNSQAGSDIGSAMITVSSYVADYQTIPQNKMFEYPPVYATSENVSMLFSTSDFNMNPVNITNITVKNVFSEREGRPIKFRFGQNYTNNCTGTHSSCGIDAFLSGLSSGGYMIEFEVNSSGSLQTVQYKFEIKNFIFSVPQIYEGWTNDYATPEKTLDAWNGEDTCDTQLHLQWWDICQSETDKICLTQIGGNPTNITLPITKNSSSQFSGDRLCIQERDGGRWQPASAQFDQCQGNKFVFIAANGSNAWVGNSSDLSAAATLFAGSTFTVPGYPGLNWTVNSFMQGEPNYVRIKHYGVICSRDNRPEGGVVKIVPPPLHVNYSTFYHGPSYIVGDMWNQQNCMGQDMFSVRCKLNISDRPAYVYHNTTHLWLYPSVTDANFTDGNPLVQGPVAVGGIINDGQGGQWKIMSISKSKVTLKGLNILSNGIMVNTSLSTSGNIRMGELDERSLGFQNKMSRSMEGMDIDGDGMTNGTVVFLILDSSNGYDKLAFSSDYTKKWNMTNVIDVNNLNRTQRQIGVGAQKLTLLSIDPRASNVKFYDPRATGDWPELGDSRAGSNVTIPVIIKSPNGSPVVANVSVPNMKIKTSGFTTIVPTDLNPVQMNGSGEIRINVSALGYGAGRYEFEVRAQSGANEEKLNEWMWPRTVMRDFLVDSYAGYGGIATSFVAMNIRSYGGWESQSRIRQLSTINQTGSPEVRGAMESVQHMIDPSSCNFVQPPNAGIHPNNRTYILDRLDSQYFAYLTEANQTIMWIKGGNCNFTGGQFNYSVRSPVNITLGNDKYMLYVLDANISSNIASIGLADFNPGIEPIRVDNWGDNPSPTWALLSLNKSGTIYNVVFANDTSLSYPQAGTWGMQDTAKAAWIGRSGNFSPFTAGKYLIGQNFTASEYVARIGPGPWDGIVIADSSNLSSIGINANPGLDAKAMDGTPSYFGKINESDPSVGLDLNMDGDMTDVFYVAAFDDFEDGQQQLTRIYVDDDLNMTEPWWSNSSMMQEGGIYSYYDFYGLEEGSVSEQDGSMPKGMWGGNVRFAPRNQSQSWEQSAEWNVKSYNGTNMILEKNVWNMNVNRTISLTLKVFDFSQTPLAGAQVSLVKLMRFGGGQPFSELNASQNFSVTNVQNVTDINGYAMLKLVPPSGGWLDGAEYIATLQVVYGGKTETMDNWFRVGQQGGGG